jgi:hypothetical protein
VKPTAKADLPGSPGTVLFTILTPTSAGVPWAAFAAFKTAAAFLLTVSIQDTSSFDTKSCEPRLAADAADLVDTSRMYRSTLALLALTNALILLTSAAINNPQRHRFSYP